MIYLPQVHITKNSTMGWCRVSEYNLPITGTSHDKYGHCTSKITHNYSGWGGAWCRQPQCSKQQNNEQQTHASTHAGRVQTLDQSVVVMDYTYCLYQISDY